LDPRSAWKLGIATWPVIYTGHFHASATVDASLNVPYPAIADRPYYVDHVSRILSKEELTFPIEVEMTFVDAANGVSWSDPITIDPSVCNSINGGIVVQRLPTTLGNGNFLWFSHRLRLY
jgi:hypothetical protein